MGDFCLLCQPFLTTQVASNRLQARAVSHAGLLWMLQIKQKGHCYLHQSPFTGTLKWSWTENPFNTNITLIDVNWQRVSTPGNSVKHGVFLESISESAEMVTTKNDTWLCSTCPPCMLSYCLGLEPSLLCFARRKPYVCMAESVIQKLQVLALRSTNQRIVNFKVSLWFQACKFWAWAF